MPVRFHRVVRRRSTGSVAALLLFAAIALPAVDAVAQKDPGRPLPDQPYPYRPIRMIVASSVGSASDYFARVLSDPLAATYHQQIVIDNRPGAGGLIGNAMISRATPGGYTLGMIGVTRLVSELVRDDPPYRALDDIVAVTQVASIANVITIAPVVSARNLPELVTYVRARPGDLNFASIGIGSSSHIAAEIFTRAARANAEHVPFRSLSDVFVEMLLGRVHYAVLTIPAAMPMLREGKLRALAVTTQQRSHALPDVPTVYESGLPEAGFENWSGIVAPAGTPRRVVEQLHGDIIRVLRRPDVREQFARQGAEPTARSMPDHFMRLMQTEYLRYQSLIRDAGIKPQ